MLLWKCIHVLPFMTLNGIKAILMQLLVILDIHWKFNAIINTSYLFALPRWLRILQNCYKESKENNPTLCQFWKWRLNWLFCFCGWPCFNRPMVLLKGWIFGSCISHYILNLHYEKEVQEVALFFQEPSKTKRFACTSPVVSAGYYAYSTIRYQET